MTTTDAAQEEWRAVIGYEGSYEVSSLGRVRSIDRTIMRNGYPARLRGRILRLLTRGKDDTRLVVTLGQSDQRRVHHLVLESFVGPRPPGLIGCHNDGNDQNNAATNLRWDTHSSNNFDQVKHGTHPEASKEVCPRGHRLEEPNLVQAWLERGCRYCLACYRTTTNIRSRGGGDLQIESDAEYELIMSGKKPEGFLASRCKKGLHELTPENTALVRSHGRRVRICRECRKEYERRWYAARRQKRKDQAVNAVVTVQP